MTVVGPYRLLRTLGTCEAGKVWSAFDAEGTSVTVAVIDGPRGASESWLQSFGHRTDQIAAAEQVAIVAQDLSAAPPWIAVAWDGDLGAARLFTATGLNVTSSTSGRGAPAARAESRPADPTPFREVTPATATVPTPTATVPTPTAAPS